MILKFCSDAYTLGVCRQRPIHFLTCWAVKSGCSASARAASPVTIGAAMEVPLFRPYSLQKKPPIEQVRGIVLRMSTPGAATVIRPPLELWANDIT